MTKRKLKRRWALGAIGSASLIALVGTGTAFADGDKSSKLGFAPITTNALSCSANGFVAFANNSKNQPVTPFKLMQAGDAATPVNAPATSTKVGRVNDMIALSPNGKYLFTTSENSIPTENGVGTPSASPARILFNRQNDDRRFEAPAQEQHLYRRRCGGGRRIEGGVGPAWRGARAQ